MLLCTVLKGFMHIKNHIPDAWGREIPENTKCSYEESWRWASGMKCFPSYYSVKQTFQGT